MKESEDSYSSSSLDEPLASPEELEEHMLVEVSITSVRNEEAIVHRVIEESLEFLCKDRVLALLRPRKEAKKQTRIRLGTVAKYLGKWKAAPHGNPLADIAEASGTGTC